MNQSSLLNGLAVSLGIDINTGENKKVVQNFADSIKDYFDNIKVDIDIVDAIKNLKVLKTQMNEINKLQSVKFSTQSSSGQQYDFSYNAKSGQVSLTKEITNNTRLQNQYLAVVKEVANYKEKINKIQLEDTGTKRNTEALKLYNEELNKVQAKRQSMENQMKNSTADFSGVLSKAGTIDTNSAAKMSLDATSAANANADARRNIILREYNDLQQKTLNIQKMITTEESRANQSFASNTKERKQLLTTLNKMQDDNVKKLKQMEQAQKSEPETYKKMKDSAEGYKQQLSVIRQQSQAMQSTNKGFFRDILNGWKDATARVVNYTIAYRVLWGSISMFRDAVEAIETLNKSFVDIQMVTGYTNEQIAKLSDSYGDLAREMGTTIDQVAEGSTSWLRQGKTIEETDELLRQSLIFSKVGAMDAASATEYLTSYEIISSLVWQHTIANLFNCWEILRDI